MVPFKPYFTGDETPPFRRATSSQKCARAGGKHNDLDDVGRTQRHLVFFEMLGNFSFGDYFKADAIPCSVGARHRGPRLRSRPPLDHRPRLRRRSRADLDRCGRGSDGTHPAPRRQRELLADGRHRALRSVLGDLLRLRARSSAPRAARSTAPSAAIVEIWNLVFMQYNQASDGSRTPLPKPSIDTGAGLERNLAVLQGVDPSGRPTCCAR